MRQLHRDGASLAACRRPGRVHPHKHCCFRLWGNRISDEGAKAIAASLKPDSALRVLLCVLAAPAARIPCAQMTVGRPWAREAGCTTTT